MESLWRLTWPLGHACVKTLTVHSAHRIVSCNLFRLKISSLSIHRPIFRILCRERNLQALLVNMLLWEDCPARDFPSVLNLWRNLKNARTHVQPVWPAYARVCTQLTILAHCYYLWINALFFFNYFIFNLSSINTLIYSCGPVCEYINIFRLIWKVWMVDLLWRKCASIAHMM